MLRGKSMALRSHAIGTLLLLIAATACSKDSASSDTSASQAAATPSAANAQADEDLSDISKYKLSMDKIDKYIQSQRNLAAKLKSMTPAERQALKDRGEASDANASLDDM